MRRRFGTSARAVAGVLAVALILAGGAPALAAENELAAEGGKTLLASAQAAAAARPLPSGALAQATTAPPAAGDTGKGFFGTTAGRLALVVMAAGTGFMVYSAFKDNDPVASVFRN